MMYGVPNMKTDKVRPQVNAALNHIAFISSSPPPPTIFLVHPLHLNFLFTAAQIDVVQRRVDLMAAEGVRFVVNAHVGKNVEVRVWRRVTRWEGTGYQVGHGRQNVEVVVAKRGEGKVGRAKEVQDSGSQRGRYVHRDTLP